MERFRALYKQQKDAIKRISHFWTNFQKLGRANMTRANTIIRLDTLKVQFEHVSALHGKLLDVSTEELETSHDYFVHDQYQDCYDEYCQTIARLQEHLSSLSVSSASSSHHADEPAINQGGRVKLPQIEIPKYDGSYINWESFRDQFNDLIISSPELKNASKLHYLRNALPSDALKIINHLPVTDANFPIAWERIKERYDVPRKIMEQHLSSLLALPKQISDTADEIRRVLDSVVSSLQALANYEFSLDRLSSVLLTNEISRRFQSTLQDWWAQNTYSIKEPPTFDKLRELMIARISILENKAKVEPISAVKPNRNRVHSLSTQVQGSKCVKCKSPHKLWRCQGFLNLSPADRLKFVGTHKLCKVCLEPHPVSNCKVNWTCRKCALKHNTLLHLDNKVPDTKSEEVKPSETVTCQTAFSERRQQILLATAKVRVYFGNNSACVRALLDQGSEVTLVSERLVQMLRATRTKMSTNILGIGSASVMAKYNLNIGVGTVSENSPRFNSQAIVLPRLTKYATKPQCAVKLDSRLQRLELADNPFSQDAIDVILGADVYAYLLCDGLVKVGNGMPVAQNTIFGWVLSGRLPAPTGSKTFVVLHATLQDISRDIHQLWELEKIPAKTHLTESEKAVEDHFKATYSRQSDGRFIVRLPFKQGCKPNLGESRQLALRRLVHLERRLAADPPLSRAYSHFLEEYRTLGHMSLVNSDSVIFPPNYIPHHAVVRAAESPESELRLRVVFDASARTRNGTSLNSFLEAGPKLQSDLASIILRWRQYRYVATADIVKMFRQILIHPEDRDFQRILWRSKPEEPPQEFRLDTVTYGTTCAPYLSLRTLRQLAVEDGAQYPKAATVLLNNTYVDDCLFGANTVNDAKLLREELISLLRLGGFELGKWASNHPSLIPCSPHVSVVSDASSQKTFDLSEVRRILGICWSADSDTFNFKIQQVSGKCHTKRQVLSILAKLYDPLGWVAPVTVTGKIQFQQLWLESLDWDDSLPDKVLVNGTITFHSFRP